MEQAQAQIQEIIKDLVRSGETDEGVATSRVFVEKKVFLTINVAFVRAAGEDGLHRSHHRPAFPQTPHWKKRHQQ